MLEIIKTHDDRKHLRGGIYRIDIQYKAEKITDEVIRQLLAEAESEYLPHAHILCRTGEDVPKKIYRKFRNIKECTEELDAETVEICTEFTLRRLDQSVSLTYDIDTGSLCMSGIVPIRRKEFPFSEYEYYWYRGRVVREHNYSYEVIDGGTGEWREQVYYYEYDFVFDRDDLSEKEAEEIIKREKDEGERRLLHHLDIAFGRYGKEEEELIPDFRERIEGTEYERAVTPEELVENAHYVSSLDGTILKAVRSWEGNIIFESYNVDANGMFFWDSYNAIFEKDLQEGRTQLWRLPEECVKELDSEIRKGTSYGNRIRGQWFARLVKRAADDEKKWLTHIAEAAVQEHRKHLEADENSDERLSKFERESLQNKVHDAVESLSIFSEKDYALFWFEKSYADCANCIILFALRIICEFGLNGSRDWFLVRLPESTASEDEMLGLGSGLREKLEEMGAFYSGTDITVHTAEWHSEQKENYKRHAYYKDLEDGGIWDWVYETTPGYSQEDGWWHNKPVRIEA